MMDDAQIGELIARQEPGWSLSAPLYRDPAVFAAETRLLFPRQWVLLAHESELPSGGWLVRSLFGESLLLTRVEDGEPRAFFNVCTHRGSRLCAEDRRGRLIVCPYHAWAFDLAGRLVTREDLPDGVDPDQLGLRPAPLRRCGGFLLGGLAADSLPDTAAAEAALAPICEHHGLDAARVVARRRYPIAANWKLVMENFFECYHCRPAHPEYMSANGHVVATAERDLAGAAGWTQALEAWRAAGDAALNAPRRDPGAIDRMAFSVYRQPIGAGRKSLSEDGEPVGPLMGRFTAFDGGDTAMHFGRLSFVSAANDHATMMQIAPLAADRSEIVLTWLVDARAPGDLDVERLTWMWDVTTRQDVRLIEDNAAGVASRAYRPGPYTRLEAQTAAFVATWSQEMAQLLADPS